MTILKILISFENYLKKYIIITSRKMLRKGKAAFEATLGGSDWRVNDSCDGMLETSTADGAIGPGSILFCGPAGFDTRDFFSFLLILLLLETGKLLSLSGTGGTNGTVSLF
jgi:hypothetical protein